MLEPLLTLFMFVPFSVRNAAPEDGSTERTQLFCFIYVSIVWLGDRLLLLYLYFLIALSIFCCCFVWCVTYVFFLLKLSSHLYVIFLSTSTTIIYPGQVCPNLLSLTGFFLLC